MPCSLHYLPLVVFVWFPTTFLITYIIAVCRMDTLPLLPYISDTGTFSPESCIFGQLLNAGSVLLAFTVYIRYKQILILTSGEDASVYCKPANVNKLSLKFGLLASLGISVVGNFQETNVFAVHIIGALMAFVIGCVYLFTQVFISFAVLPLIGKKSVNVFRYVLAVICCVFCLSSSIFAAVSLYYFRGNDITKWRQEDGGYEFHLVSSFSEWVTAISMMMFVLTFTEDFRNVKFEDISISIGNERVDSRNNKIEPVDTISASVSGVSGV